MCEGTYNYTSKCFKKLSIPQIKRNQDYISLTTQSITFNKNLCHRNVIIIFSIFITNFNVCHFKSIAVPCLYHFHLYIQTKEKRYNQQKSPK